MTDWGSFAEGLAKDDVSKSVEVADARSRLAEMLRVQSEYFARQGTEIARMLRGRQIPANITYKPRTFTRARHGWGVNLDWANEGPSKLCRLMTDGHWLNDRWEDRVLPMTASATDEQLAYFFAGQDTLLTTSVPGVAISADGELSVYDYGKRVGIDEALQRAVRAILATP